MIDYYPRNYLLIICHGDVKHNYQSKPQPSKIHKNKQSAFKVHVSREDRGQEVSRAFPVSASHGLYPLKTINSDICDNSIAQEKSCQVLEVHLIL